MRTTKPVGIFGGSFDPIHFGHLRMALEVYQQYDLQEVRLIPCQQSVLKKNNYANVKQRLQMLKLALGQQKELIIDKRELQRKTPSFTIDTLKSLRDELNDTPIWLIIGSDTLAELDRWKHWEELIDFAHLLIIVRPEYNLPKKGVIAKFIQQHLTTKVDLLRKRSAGKIYIAHLTPLTISATAIRNMLKNDENPRYLLPENVLKYINQHKIYK